MTATTSNAGRALTPPRTGILIAGWAGVMWPVLAFLRVPLTRVLDQPSWTAVRSDIVSYYTGSTFDTGFVVGMAMVTGAYVLYLVFVARVAGLVPERHSRWVG